MLTHRLQKAVNVAFAFAIVVGASFLFVQQASAETTANVLKVSPIRTDIQIEAGQTGVVKVTVSNVTNDVVSVRPVVNDFIAGDQSGTPALILDEDEYAPSHSLKRFMGELAPITIPAQGSVVVEAPITVPASAQAGGYFGAVRFAPSNPDDGGQVNMSPSVASLILLTVPGDIVDNIELSDFSIEQDGNSSNVFSGPNAIQATALFKNLGNMQIGPIGTVTVRQNGMVVYETEFNNKDPRDMILPDSSRRWDIPLQKLGGFGKYDVTATFTYGLKNQTIEVTRSFWIIPPIVITLGVIGLLILVTIVVVVIVVIRRRKSRRHITFSGRR